MKILVALSSVSFLLLALAPAWAAPGPGLPVKDVEVDEGVPQWAATPAKPMIIEINEINPADNTKTIKRTVTVNNLPAFAYPVPAPYVRPVYNGTDTQQVYNGKVKASRDLWQATVKANNKAAWEAASKDKADKIAAAVNGVLGAGRATSTTFVNGDGFTQGRVAITNVQKIGYGARSNTTGEVGDGARFKNGVPGGTSPYPYKVSMGITSGSFVASATGVDPNGGPSAVEFGVAGVYVSSWFPNPGDSLDQILTLMDQDLNDNGVPATYDPTHRVITLSNDYTDLDSIVWSMDEQAFDPELGITFGTNAPESVPEPASLLLLGVGASVLMKRRKRMAYERGG